LCSGCKLQPFIQTLWYVISRYQPRVRWEVCLLSSLHSAHASLKVYCTAYTDRSTIDTEGLQPSLIPLVFHHACNRPESALDHRWNSSSTGWYVRMILWHAGMSGRTSSVTTSEQQLASCVGKTTTPAECVFVKLSELAADKVGQNSHIYLCISKSVNASTGKLLMY
jgi:hypothetical protein